MVTVARELGHRSQAAGCYSRVRGGEGTGDTGAREQGATVG